MSRTEAGPPPSDLPADCVRGVVVNTRTTDDNEGRDYYAEVAWRQDGQLRRATLHGGWEGLWGEDSGIGLMRPGDVLHGKNVTEMVFLPHEDTKLEPRRLVKVRVPL